MGGCFKLSPWQVAPEKGRNVYVWFLLFIFFSFKDFSFLQISKKKKCLKKKNQKSRLHFSWRAFKQRGKKGLDWKAVQHHYQYSYHWTGWTLLFSCEIFSAEENIPTETGQEESAGSRPCAVAASLEEMLRCLSWNHPCKTKQINSHLVSQWKASRLQLNQRIPRKQQQKKIVAAFQSEPLAVSSSWSSFSVYRANSKKRSAGPQRFQA